jgi:hypothetical protein
MAASTTFINNLLEAAFKGETYTGGTIRMGLFLEGGAEVSGGSYERQELTFDAAADKKILTSADAAFTGLPTGQTITAYRVFDGETQIDQGLLAAPFTATIDNNQIEFSYSFTLEA